MGMKFLIFLVAILGVLSETPPPHQDPPPTEEPTTLPPVTEPVPQITPPWIEISNHQDRDMSSFIIRTAHYERNLQSFDNLLGGISACRNGYWIAYTGAQFSGGVVTTSSLEGCKAFEPSVQGKLISIRYAGSSEDINAPALTFYNGLGYRDNETKIYENNSNVENLHFKSLVLSGPTPVTFFTKRDFTGFSLCVRATEGSVTEIMDIEQDLGITSNDVGSIQFGCTSKNIVHWLKGLFK